MNKTILVGNLTKDPDLRQTSAGTAVCTFTLAVQRRFSDASGERKADFIPVVCWRGLAENAAKYLRKGSKAAVVGSLQVRSYEANDGTKRFVTEVLADEVEFLSTAQSARQDGTGYEAYGDYGDIDDEEMPF